VTVPFSSVLPPTYAPPPVLFSSSPLFIQSGVTERVDDFFPFFFCPPADGQDHSFILFFTFRRTGKLTPPTFPPSQSTPLFKVINLVWNGFPLFSPPAPPFLHRFPFFLCLLLVPALLFSFPMCFLAVFLWFLSQQPFAVDRELQADCFFFGFSC